MMDLVLGTNLRGTTLRGKRKQKMLPTHTLLKTQKQNCLGFWKPLLPP